MPWPREIEVARNARRQAIIDGLLAKANKAAQLRVRGGRLTRDRQLNYRRGLFRLWVILSVLWVAGVAFVSGPDVYRMFERRASDLTAIEGTLRNMIDRGDHEEDIDKYLKSQGFTPEQFRNRKPWPALLRTIASFAFLPPLALLALGAALGWMLSGFRQR